MGTNPCATKIQRRVLYDPKSKAKKEITNERRSQTPLGCVVRAAEGAELLIPFAQATSLVRIQPHPPVYVPKHTNGPLAQRQSGRLLTGRSGFRNSQGLPRRAYPNGRGSGSRSRPVSVRVGPRAPRISSVTPAVGGRTVDAMQASSTLVRSAIRAWGSLAVPASLGRRRTQVQILPP